MTEYKLILILHKKIQVIIAVIKVWPKLLFAVRLPQYCRTFDKIGTNLTN